MEKEANLLEVKHWIQQAKNYIEAGYKDCPPEKGVYNYILPLLHHTRAKSLDKTDPYNRTLQELTDSLENEAKRGDLKYSRRLKSLQIRRGSNAHSDFIDKLREAASVIEFSKMSLDEFIIHLFIRDADSTMAKMAQEILKDEIPDIKNLVNKIKETENESWYKNKKELGRMVSVRPPRYCKACD